MAKDTVVANIDFLGVRVFIARDEDAVTGRVEYPYPVADNTQCCINYRSIRPQNNKVDKRSLDDRTIFRHGLVTRYRDAIKRPSKLTKQRIAKMIVDSADRSVSMRSLQGWVRRFETQGIYGLVDRYATRSPKTLVCNSDDAKKALLVCAWWSFRIGGISTIDTKMMYAALRLIQTKYLQADLISTIDCYYSWPTDRVRYPFKAFARWCRYDVDKWFFRAADKHDYRRQYKAAQDREVPLQRLISTMSVALVDTKTRSRDTNHRRTTSAIRKLAWQDDSSHPEMTNAHVCQSTCKHTVQSNRQMLSAARSLKSIGLDQASRQVRSDIDTGVESLAANKDPQTVAEALGLLDDRFRSMLIDAGRGDQQAKSQAIATMPLWWEIMPTSIRSNIDFRLDAWRKEHPHVTDRQVASRRFAMLQSHLRPGRSGVQRLGVAMRMI